MWKPFKKKVEEYYEEPWIEHKVVFNLDEVPADPWVCIPSGTPVQWNEAYYATSGTGTSSIASQYTTSNIVRCSYCGTRNVTDNLKVMNCACCGAPL